MENVWVKYNEKVNEILRKELGHCNRMSQDVIMRNPDAILQNLVLVDILVELKELNSKISKKEEIKEIVEEVDKAVKTKKNSK